MSKFGNVSKVIDAEKEQCKASKSELEIERIVYLTNQFGKEHKLTPEESLGYIMEKIGYKKCNYIPAKYDDNDLFGLGQLTAKYLRVYGIRPETFIHKFVEKHNYCMINGYHYDIGQKTLEEIMKGG